MSAAVAEAAPSSPPDNQVVYDPARNVWGIRCLPHIAIRVKRLFPRAEQGRSGVIVLADTPEVARDLEWLLERHPMDFYDDVTAHRLTARADEHRAIEETRMAVLSGRRRVEGLRAPAVPPREYQRIAADLAHQTGRLLIGDDLGLGKTFSALLLLRDPEALPAVVVCPTHLPRQWMRELHKFLPWLTGHVAKTRDPYQVDCDVLFVPYSKVYHWRDYLAGTARTVIFDEVQELRRPGTFKYDACAQIADAAHYKVGLSATPVYNYGDEIHSIYDVLAKDALGSRTEFLREWGGGTGSNGKTMVKNPAALGTFLRAEGLLLRRTKADVGMELPSEPMKMLHEVDCDRSALDAVADDVAAMAELVLSQTAATKDRFTAAGNMDWRLRQATGVAKAPYVAAFVDMLLESQEKVVLIGWHRQVYDIWAEKLAKHSPVFYTGSESPNQKDAAVKAFTEGTSRVFVMSLRSGSGLDGLQEAASTVVFGELDWSPAMHDQVVGRLDRPGQSGQVLAYYLTSAEGSDPVVADVLEVKRQQSEPIRDPNRPLLAPAAKSTDRMRLLAESVLARKRAK